MTARIDLPPEAAADLYLSGATVRQVADRFGCSWGAARNAVIRAHVDIRPRVAKGRTPAVVPRWLCLDCGEDLDRPHQLGAHVPGCSHGTAS